MKTLKKPLSLLCALAMILSLAACGDKKDNESGIYTPAPTPAKPRASTAP